MSVSPTSPTPTNTYGEESPTGPKSEIKDEWEGKPMNIIMGLLKDLRNGVDITRGSIPTFLLEPRSLTERFTSFMDHSELLLSRSNLKSPLDRMLSVTTWFFSGWHDQFHGVTSPCNPTHGEFFRCWWDQSNGTRTWYMAEQVTHHPPVTAFRIENSGRVCHSNIRKETHPTKSVEQEDGTREKDQQETPDNAHPKIASVSETLIPTQSLTASSPTSSDSQPSPSHSPSVPLDHPHTPTNTPPTEPSFSVTGDVQIDITLYGNSVAVGLVGMAEAKIKQMADWEGAKSEPEETYCLSFPTVWCGGIVFGKRVLELKGEVEIVCPETKTKAVLFFKGKPWLFGNYHQVSGWVGDLMPTADLKQHATMELRGNWKTHLEMCDFRELGGNGGGREDPKNMEQLRAKKRKEPWKRIFSVETAPQTSMKVVPLELQEPIESRIVWTDVCAALRNHDIDTAGVFKSKIEKDEMDKAKMRRYMVEQMCREDEERQVEEAKRKKEEQTPTDSPQTESTTSTEEQPTPSSAVSSLDLTCKSCDRYMSVSQPVGSTVTTPQPPPLNLIQRFFFFDEENCRWRWNLDPRNGWNEEEAEVSCFNVVDANDVMRRRRRERMARTSQQASMQRDREERIGPSFTPMPPFFNGEKCRLERRGDDERVRSFDPTGVTVGETWPEHYFPRETERTDDLLDEKS